MPIKDQNRLEYLLKSEIHIKNVREERIFHLLILHNELSP